MLALLRQLHDRRQRLQEPRPSVPRCLALLAGLSKPLLLVDYATPVRYGEGDTCDYCGVITLRGPQLCVDGLQYAVYTRHRECLLAFLSACKATACQLGETYLVLRLWLAGMPLDVQRRIWHAYLADRLASPERPT
jgi:hypothetical protein